MGHIFKNRGVLFWPLIGMIALFIVGATPSSRYWLAGLFIKHDFAIRVLDSTTGQPVSNAAVSNGASNATTDPTGKAVLHAVKPGKFKIAISKPYYATSSVDVLAPIGSQKDVASMNLLSTGNLVEATVKDLITGQTLAGATIKNGEVVATTDSNGRALLAVAPDSTSQSVQVDLEGYNSKPDSLTTKAGAISKSIISLAPKGQIYYLSRSNGKINLVRSNLDGSSAKVVLRGSGNEGTEAKTIASPDNKYIALISRRTPDPNPQIYMIDIATDKLSQVTFGPSLKLLGWIGGNLYWQTATGVLKSFDPASQKTTSADESSLEEQLQKLMSSKMVSADNSMLAWSSNGQVVVGDVNGENPKVIADGYSLVNWYDSKYLLLNKNSTLYITGTGGGTPIKIVDRFVGP